MRISKIHIKMEEENQVVDREAMKDENDEQYGKSKSAKKRNRKKKNQTANSIEDQESGSRDDMVIPNTCNVSIKDIQMAMDAFNLQQKPAKTQEEALQKPYQFWSTQPVPKMEIKMDGEKVDPGVKENNVKPVTNELANLKIEDNSGSTTPESPAAGTGSFLSSFKSFAKFGDTKSDGKQITLSQSDKWMKQAKVIDGKKITTTDTGIYFKKHKSMKLNVEQYKAFLEELSKAKKVDFAVIKSKMANCGPPGVTGTTGAGKAASTVDRLTDVSKYTGSHKQRFDEAGKGKGISGRKDIPDNSGYVQGYQNKDTHKAL